VLCRSTSKGAGSHRLTGTLHSDTSSLALLLGSHVGWGASRVCCPLPAMQCKCSALPTWEVPAADAGCTPGMRCCCIDDMCAAILLGVLPTCSPSRSPLQRQGASENCALRPPVYASKLFIIIQGQLLSHPFLSFCRSTLRSLDAAGCSAHGRCRGRVERGREEEVRVQPPRCAPVVLFRSPCSAMRRTGPLKQRILQRPSHQRTAFGRSLACMEGTVLSRPQGRPGSCRLLTFSGRKSPWKGFPFGSSPGPGAILK